MSAEMGARRFGRMNWLGLYTLIWREVMRFATVWSQTILAPLVTAALFIAIFSLAIGAKRGDVMGVPFVHFIAPGILMMTVIQNAFANTSSSLVISKVQGNIVDTLMPPLSPLELVVGYMSGGIARGILVACRRCRGDHRAEIRPDCRDHKFHCDPAELSFRHILFDRRPAQLAICGEPR
jgi:ABC-2 type transport system permease protein